MCGGGVPFIAFQGRFGLVTDIGELGIQGGACRRKLGRNGHGRRPFGHIMAVRPLICAIWHLPSRARSWSSPYDGCMCACSNGGSWRPNGNKMADRPWDVATCHRLSRVWSWSLLDVGCVGFLVKNVEGNMHVDPSIQSEAFRGPLIKSTLNSRLGSIVVVFPCS
jgi:hypothetical protein